MNSLTHRLAEYLRACFTGLWIRTFEPEDALRDIARLCRDNRWPLATWDIDRGLSSPGTAGTPRPPESPESVGDASGAQAAPSGGSADPVAAIKSINALTSTAGNDGADHSAVLVMINLHRFLGSAEIVQALAHQLVAGRQNRTFIIVLSPLVQIPIELERLFVVIEHELPDRDQLEEIARGVATEEGELPDGSALQTVLDAASGLTRCEAENAFSLALVRHRRIEPGAVWELKTQALKKSGLLELHRGAERFSDLGGLDALKSFCLRALGKGSGGSARSGAVGEPPGVRARGVMLLSPPGCGKPRPT